MFPPSISSLKSTVTRHLGRRSYKDLWEYNMGRDLWRERGLLSWACLFTSCASADKLANPVGPNSRWDAPWNDVARLGWCVCGCLHVSYWSHYCFLLLEKLSILWLYMENKRALLSQLLDNSTRCCCSSSSCSSSFIII